MALSTDACWVLKTHGLEQRSDAHTANAASLCHLHNISKRPKLKGCRSVALSTRKHPRGFQKGDIRRHKSLTIAERTSTPGTCKAIPPGSGEHGGLKLLGPATSASSRKSLRFFFFFQAMENCKMKHFYDDSPMFFLFKVFKGRDLSTAMLNYQRVVGSERVSVFDHQIWATDWTRSGKTWHGLFPKLLLQALPGTLGSFWGSSSHLRRRRRTQPPEPQILIDFGGHLSVESPKLRCSHVWRWK